MNTTNTSVCSAKHAPVLDNSFRKKLHNPYKLFGDIIKTGDTVYDLGCGPGTFIVELAEMAGSTGKVIAVDLQEKMLDMAAEKTRQFGIEHTVFLHKCAEDKIGFKEEADVIIGFFMVHEVPDADAFFKEVSKFLKPGGFFLLAEPLFHVKKSLFENEVKLAEKYGLTKVADKKVFFARGAVLRKKG